MDLASLDARAAFSLTPFLGWLLRTSASAAAVALLVLIVQVVVGRWLTPKWRLRLWGLVVLRLLLPGLPPSPTSLGNIDLASPSRRLAVLAGGAHTGPSAVATQGPQDPPPVIATPPPTAAREVVVHPRVAVTYELGSPQPAQSDTRPTANGISKASPPPPPQPMRRSPIGWAEVLPSLLAGAWFAVAALLLARLIRANLALSRRLGRASPLTSGPALALLDECCRMTALSRRPALLVTDAVRAPAAAGVWRPKILLPPGLLCILSAEEQRAVLLHELAHVRSRDVAVNWILAVLQAIHWFNPVVWFAFARLRADREVARDAMVLSFSSPAAHGDAQEGDVPLAAHRYAQTLLRLTEHLSGRPRALSVPAVAGLAGIVSEPSHPLMPGLFGTRSGLHRRLRMITRRREIPRRLRLLGPTVLLALAYATLTGARQVQPPADDDRGPIPTTLPTTRPSTRPTQRADKTEFEKVRQQLEDARRLGERTITDLIRTAIQLTGEGKYREAIAVVDQILLLEPRNDYALGVRPLLEDKAVLSEQRGLRELFDRERLNTPFEKVRQQLDDARRLRERTVADLASTARQLASKGKYDEGLRVIEQLLILDAEHAYALGLRRFLEARKAATRPGAAVGDAGADDREAELDHATHATLERRLPEVKFDGAGLSDVIDFLRDMSGANIFVNWKALELAGIGKNDPVTTRLYNVKVGKALQIILDGVSRPHAKAAFIVDDGVITVSDERDFPRNTLTRVYDVGDLIIDVPDFEPAGGGGLGLMPASRPSRAPAAATQLAITREKRVAGVVRLITDTVAQDSWRENRGEVGSIRELSGQLVITQTPENHLSITKLLGQLRETRGFQVHIESRFVSCDEQVIKRLVAEWEQAGKPITRPLAIGERAAGLSAATTRPAPSSIGFFLNDEQVRQVLEASQARGDSALVAAPRMTLLNGQRAGIFVASQRTYVRDYRTVRSANGDMRYEAVSGVAEVGLMLDVQAILSVDRKWVTLTLGPRVSALLGVDEAPWPGRPEGSNLVIEQPRIKTSEIKTTVSVPDHGTLLLGGLQDPGIAGAVPPTTRTADNAAGSPAPTTQPSGRPKSLFMLVKPSIVFQRPAEQKADPPQNERKSGEN